MTDHATWVKTVFDKTASDYGEIGPSFFTYFGERLVEYAPPSQGNTILDIATGKGAVLFPAAKLVGPQGSAIGIDLSPKMIEETTKKVVFPWVQLYQMDGEHLLFSDHSFDLVFCALSLFFFANVDKALAECKRVLKSDGRLAVSIFGEKSILDSWFCQRAKELGATIEMRKNSLRSNPTLKERLTRAGFTQIEIHEESKVFWYENGEEWWNSLWTRGSRSSLEQLTPYNLEKLKKEALLYVGNGRISEERQIFYAIAKPQLEQDLS